MKTTKFKPSEVGPIPEEWEVKALGEVGVFSKGLGVSRSESNSGALPCVRYGEIYTDYNDYIKEFRSFISEKVAAGAKLMSPGDILFAGSGETKEEIGKTVAFLGGVDRAYCGGDILILSPSRGYDSKFLGYVCNSQPIVAQKASRGQGDAVVHIRSGSLAEVVIPVPPRPEQEKIAEALSDVDALLAAMTKLIEKKRAIKQGAMQQLLAGKKRLAGFTGKWVEKRFDECFDLVGNNTFAREFMCHDATGIANIHYGDVLIKYGSVLDFSTTQVDSLTSSLLGKSESLKNGDLIIADTAEDETVGKAVEVQHLGTRQAVAGLHTIACRPTMGFAPGWLGYYINSSAFHDQLLPLITGTKVSSISKAGLRTTVLHVPDLVEQQAIALVLSDMDAEIAALEAKRAKYESVKQGMMQELLTGKTRLV